MTSTNLCEKLCRNKNIKHHEKPLVKKKYSEKLEVIKENYFPKQQSETITEELENTEEEQTSSEPDVDPIMSKYASALTRLNK